MCNVAWASDSNYFADESNCEWTSDSDSESDGGAKALVSDVELDEKLRATEFTKESIENRKKTAFREVSETDVGKRKTDYKGLNTDAKKLDTRKQKYTEPIVDDSNKHDTNKQKYTVTFAEDLQTALPHTDKRHTNKKTDDSDTEQQTNIEEQEVSVNETEPNDGELAKDRHGIQQKVVATGNEEILSEELIIIESESDMENSPPRQLSAHRSADGERAVAGRWLCKPSIHRSGDGKGAVAASTSSAICKPRTGNGDRPVAASTSSAVCRPRGSLYTQSEKKRIVAYIIEHQGYQQLGGKTFWEKMENAKICPGRTWQSLKEHFTKHVAPNIHRFVDPDTADIFRTSQRSSERSQKLIGQAKHYYTEKEDKVLIESMLKCRRYAAVGGNNVWKRLENMNVLPGRSWQSMRDHYRKVLINNLVGFDLSPTEAKALQLFCP